MVPVALIVDDNTNLAYFAARNLKEEVEGLKVLTAGSCEEAMIVANEHHPSVYIVDLKLPDGDGLGLINDLKSRFPGMVPILTTATPMPDGSEKGLFGLFVKPYDVEALVELVRQAVSSDNTSIGGERVANRNEQTQSSQRQPDFHRLQNRLFALLTGIRALRLELYATAEDPDGVRKTVDEYSDRLSAMVKEAAEELKRGDIER